jgi:hypothetical protein
VRAARDRADCDAGTFRIAAGGDSLTGYHAHTDADTHAVAATRPGRR